MASFVDFMCAISLDMDSNWSLNIEQGEKMPQRRKIRTQKCLNPKFMLFSPYHSVSSSDSYCLLICGLCVSMTLHYLLD